VLNWQSVGLTAYENEGVKKEFALEAAILTFLGL